VLQKVPCLKGLFLPYYHVELLLLGFDCFWLKLPVLLAVVLGQLLLQLFLVEVQVMYLLPAFLEELPLPPADSSEAVHSVGSTIDLLYQQPYLFPQVNNILPSDCTLDLNSIKSCISPEFSPSSLFSYFPRFFLKHLTSKYSLLI
jgi:hypothetical protein